LENLEKSIAEIRIRFLDRLREQHIELVGLALRIEARFEPVKDYERVQTIAHKIAGLAKSVGFEPLGIAAFFLDQAITKSNEAGDQRDHASELSGRLKTLIDECERAFRH